MLYSLRLFKRILSIFLFFALITGFVLSYNSFFLDREISSFYFILNKIKYTKNVDDRTYILPFIKKLILNELSHEEPEYLIILRLQTALDILNILSDKRQIDDVIFFIEDALKIKEKERSALLLKLDRFIIRILGSEFRLKPKIEYKNREKELIERIKNSTKKPDRQRYLYELADIYIARGDISRAIEKLNEVSFLEPHSIYSLKAECKLVLLNKLIGNFESALEVSERLYQKFKDENLSLYSQYMISGIYEYQKDFSTSEQIYDSIRLKLPDNYINYLCSFKKGYIYLYYFKNYNLSLSLYEDMVLKLPKNTIIHHINMNIIPRISIYYRNLGFFFLNQKRYQDALENFSQALKINPQDSLCYIGEAIAYLWLKDKEKALELGLKAKRLSPKNPYVLINLGYIYTYLNMYEEAIKEYKRSILISPKNKEAYYNLSYMYILKGDLDSASRFLTIAIILDPKFAEAYNNLGYVKWQKNNFNEAILAFRKATELKPDFISAHFNLALAMVIIGKYEEAKKEFERILKYEPDNEVVKANLRQIERLLSQK